MALDKITLIGLPGNYFVQHDSLKYVTAITVTREGLGYDLVDTTPGNRQCTHDPATGRIDFESTNLFYFKLSFTQRTQYETVNVTYQR